MAEPYEITPSNTTPPATSDTPQFATAEYGHIPGTERCSLCNNLIAGPYYRVNNKMACAQCAAEAQTGQPGANRSGHIAFTRGLLLGIGAAIIASALYATFTIVTGWYIGYLALGVGYLIATAIKKGSSGFGGRPYQIAAVLLTYFAISFAEVPIAVHAAYKQIQAQNQASQQDFPTEPPFEPAPQTVRHFNWSRAAPQLLWLGIASPFLELSNPLHGAIGLFILFIGLRIAWRMTASTPPHVEGPYSQGMAGA